MPFGEDSGGVGQALSGGVRYESPGNSWACLYMHASLCGLGGGGCSCLKRRSMTRTKMTSDDDGGELVESD